MNCDGGGGETNRRQTCVVQRGHHRLPPDPAKSRESAGNFNDTVTLSKYKANVAVGSTAKTCILLNPVVCCGARCTGTAARITNRGPNIQKVKTGKLRTPQYQSEDISLRHYIIIPVNCRGGLYFFTFVLRNPQGQSATLLTIAVAASNGPTPWISPPLKSTPV